jgi:hypothetical protein
LGIGYEALLQGERHQGSLRAGDGFANWSVILGAALGVLGLVLVLLKRYHFFTWRMP